MAALACFFQGVSKNPPPREFAARLLPVPKGVRPPPSRRKSQGSDPFLDRLLIDQSLSHLPQAAQNPRFGNKDRVHRNAEFARDNLGLEAIKGDPLERWQVVADGEGHAVLAGFTASPLQGSNRGSYDTFAAQLSPEGQLLWTLALGHEELDRATGLSLEDSGALLLTQDVRAAGAHGVDQALLVRRARPAGN